MVHLDVGYRAAHMLGNDADCRLPQIGSAGHHMMLPPVTQKLRELRCRLPTVEGLSVSYRREFSESLVKISTSHRHLKVRRFSAASKITPRMVRILDRDGLQKKEYSTRMKVSYGENVLF